MEYGILSCIPITVLFTGALLTRRIVEMMILSSFIGVVLVYKGAFFSGYVELMYGVLSNPSYQFILILLMSFGGMLQLLQNSGALLGFGDVIAKYAEGPKKPLIAAWIMAFIMFVDDYLSTLAVSFSMRELTDRSNIPREHLAYQVNAMAGCLCVLIPFSSWTAFTVGLLSEQGLTYADYVKAIPFMLYPIITPVICLLLAVGAIPKVGPLKKSYDRVNQGGPVEFKEKNETTIVSIKMHENCKATSSLNAFVPIVIMVIVVLMFDNDLVHGILAAIAVQAILYLSQRIMTLAEFMDSFFEGAKSMTNMAILVFFAFVLSAANTEMGLFEFLIGGLVKTVSPVMLPVLIFVVVALATFATAGYWIIQVITIPIFIPLAAAMEVTPAIAVAAVLSGAVFGCNFCFYSDTLFMTSAGTGVSNIRQIKVAAPYTLSAALLTAVGYVIIGFLFV
ncbi:MAG: Na+/H+ antiporter NhaC family protein [Anaerovoracaceae bacterium]|jgi:tetracycline resistance efflux pump